MQKERVPEIRADIYFVKRDQADFPREQITELLGVYPTDSFPPRLGPGKTNTWIDAVGEEGHSSLYAPQPPYPMLLHAGWYLQLPSQYGWDLTATEDRIACLFRGNEAGILKICNHFNLKAELQLYVYADAYNVPTMCLTAKSIGLLSAMGFSVQIIFNAD